MGRWNAYRRELQRKRIQETKPQQHIGRKTGRRFDASALSAAFVGLPKVRSW